MRFLYGIFDARPPAYVLDAGGGAGARRGSHV
jgi:hypothetical protein